MDGEWMGIGDGENRARQGKPAGNNGKKLQNKLQKKGSNSANTL